MKTGIQISSLKPMIQSIEQTRAVCEKIRAMGCDTVQLQWLGEAVFPGAAGRILRENGLRSVSVQDFFDKVLMEPDYYYRLNYSTAAQWICVSRIPEAYKSPDGLDRFIVCLQEMRSSYSLLGQKVCFHPVTGDYCAVDGMDAVEYILEKIPDLDICLDLYHLNRVCKDMPAYIRRYAGRIPMVHFKDADETGKLVPAGQGAVSWSGVVKACLDAGVEYGFAEQETWDRDPFACLKEALDWLDAEIEKAR